MGTGGGATSGATTYGRLVTYCQARQAAGWTVIVMPVLKRNDLPNFPNQAALDAFEVQRGIFNTSLRANWATFADVLLDLETLDFYNNTTGVATPDTNMDLLDPNNTIFFHADKIHLNTLGQTVVAKGVKAAIEAL
jgi:lysophospholipase L1-like esterase